METKWFCIGRRCHIAQHKLRRRLALLLGANTTGDFMLKLVFIYHSENPGTFSIGLHLFCLCSQCSLDDSMPVYSLVVDYVEPTTEIHSSEKDLLQNITTFKMGLATQGLRQECLVIAIQF